MSFLDFVKERFAESQERKKADREVIDRIRKEAEIQRRITFEEEMREKSLELAKARAKRDAATKSGYQKFKAESRLRHLNNPKSGEGFFGKMREYTQRNIAKREENLRRTEELRRLSKQQQQSGIRRKPFSPTRLKTTAGYYG